MNIQKFFKLLIITFTPLFLFGCFSEQQNLSPEENAKVLQLQLSQIDVQQAAKLISNNHLKEDFSIIDLRDFNKFQQSHIPKATNIEHNNSSFRTNLNKIPKEHMLLIYSDSDKNQKEVIATFQALGFERIYYMNGGIEAWINAGLPIDRVK